MTKRKENLVWNLDANTAKILADMITSGDEPIAITLRIGSIQEDDGTIMRGLLAFDSEYPEEGAILLAESN